MLKRSFLGFVQQLYGFAPRGSYHWDENYQVTEIVVTDEAPINLDSVGQRPAVTTVRGPLQLAGLTLGTRQSHSMLGLTKNYTDLGSCTLTLNHLASNDTVSETLAWVTANHLWLLKQLLKTGTPIHEIQQPQVGSPSPPGALVQGDTKGSWHNTTVTVPVYIQVYGTVTEAGLQILHDMHVTPTIVGRQMRGMAAVRDLYRDGAIIPKRYPGPITESWSENTIKVR